METIKSIIDAAWELEQFCKKQDWQFCFIGGIAVQRWGEPRLTIDADITLLTGFGKETNFAKSLLNSFDPRIEDAIAFSQRNRVLLCKTSNNTFLDISFGALPFEENAVGRASPFDFENGIVLTTCSAEDLLIYKAFANRNKDWADIEGILIRQGSKIDFSVVFGELAPLCELKEDPEIVLKLEKAIAKFVR